MSYQIKHECSCVLCDHCCWIMNSAATTHPSCVSCRLISWQRFIHFAWEQTKGGRQPSASHSRCWACDKLTPVLVCPAEQNGTRASCSSPSSLEAHYLGTDIQENSCCSSPWWSCRLVPHSFTESPCGPCDTSCKSKWMPPTLQEKINVNFLHFEQPVQQHHMAPYGTRTEPKRRLGNVNTVIFVWTSFIKAFKVLQEWSHLEQAVPHTQQNMKQLNTMKVGLGVFFSGRP